VVCRTGDCRMGDLPAGMGDGVAKRVQFRCGLGSRGTPEVLRSPKFQGPLPNIQRMPAVPLSRVRFALPAEVSIIAGVTAPAPQPGPGGLMLALTLGEAAVYGGHSG
jgi:hypothetical protein